ncbi:MAG: hypothetical protein ACOC46_04095 [Pirellulales bacterium]
MTHEPSPEQTSGNRSRGGPAGRADLESYASRLQRLARDVAAYLGEQLERLESALDQLDRAPSGEPADAAARHELEAQRAEWERTRRAELRQIEQDADLLADAWRRLEAEQRQLLGKGAESGRASAPADHDDAGRPVRNGARGQHGRHDDPSDREPDSYGVDRAVRDSVIRQFEQLRGDVRRHAGRSQ